MNKTLLTLCALFTGSAAFAQVSIDWSTDQIIEPTQITSTASPVSSTVNYHFVCKNNGTNDALIGDTLIFQVGILTTSNQVVIVAPTVSTFYYRVLSKKMSTGDTVHVKGTFTFGLYPNLSANVKVRIISHIIKTSRGLTFESSTIANNTKETTITWFNPQGWGVGTSELTSDNNTSVYPNQNQGTFALQLPIVSAEPVTVKMYSLDSREVKSFDFPAGSSKMDIEASDLAAGTYILESVTAGFRQSDKVQIVK